MLPRLPKHRHFSYTPRRYKPEAEPTSRKSIRFQRNDTRKPSIFRWLWVVLIILSLWLILKNLAIQ
ncbi:MAG TPA: hypothetical protein PLG25_07825 [bacterium]|nr:hypothetical protein [bacterium]HNF85307.1 hypothetical protein [bacterium]HNO10551.1 hypothetical protein [bacterium]